MHVSSSLLLTVEALMSGHPQNTKKVSVTKAGRLRGCKNTEFLWELRKTGFCEGERKQSCPLSRVSVRRATTVMVINVDSLLKCS